MGLVNVVFQDFGVKLLGLVAAFVLYLLSYAIYNIYFHSLSKYPGPKRWAATRLTYIFSLWSGWLHRDVRDLHEQYGDIVRIAPDELSFARPQAWQDIYANEPGRPAFPKSALWHGAAKGRPPSVLNAIDIKLHSRFRRAMDPAFTEKAIRMQEPIIQSHVRLLISKLDQMASSDSQCAIVDILRWISFVVFDEIGDLGFGEPFGCLESSEHHPWCSMIFSSLRAATYRVTLRYYPAINWLMGFAIPKSVVKKGMEHWQMSVDKINRRLNLEKDRPDIISMIKRDEEGVDGITYPEMLATSSVLIIAGSDGTISVLNGTIYHLVRSPDKLAILAAEIRSAFKSEEDISLSTLRDFPYLKAVLNEAMRMCNPTPVGAPRIVPPGGGTVCGERLSEGVYVNVHSLTVSRSPKLWHDSDAFRPERWLDNKSPEFAMDQQNAIQPFGVGPRSCAGRLLAWAEMRLILARLIWRFNLLPTDTEAGRMEWDQQRTFTVLERQPFEVRLKRREGVEAMD